ncbi:Os07g0546700, partial [Oryza sativa Japonica Group]
SSTQLSSAASSSAFHHAEADPRDQGLPPDGEEEGREVGADQEDQGRRQVQGALLQVPLHPLRLRRRQGQQAQAVASPGFDCPGGLSIKARPCCL